MVSSPTAVKAQARTSMPSFLAQRARAKYIDSWARGEQDRAELYMPKQQERSGEYEDIGDRSRAPWLPLIVTSMLQTLSLEGVRRGDNPSGENIGAYAAWQENGFDRYQIPLYQSALEQGIAYVKALPGRTTFGTSDTALWTPRSCRRMAVWWGEVTDEFPLFALEAEPYKEENGDRGWQVQIIDERAVHYLSCEGDGLEDSDWTYISYDEHGAGVTPVVAYEPRTDLDGRATGLIEPFIPLGRRIDQDTFDRLIVQRFGAWKVRYITGMTKPTTMSDADWAAARQKLKVSDILVGESKDTRFGTMDETQLAGFIAAHDSDLRTLSAVSQTPPHHMLGLSSNMQAESLAAAEGGLNRHSVMIKTSFGESHERLMRLSAHLRGNREEANAFDLQVRWRDMEVRSLSQAADALGKLATQLGVPQEMLFEKIPGWTDYDVARAKELVESGAFDALVAAIESQAATTPGQPAQQPAAPAGI